MPTADLRGGGSGPTARLARTMSDSRQGERLTPAAHERLKEELRHRSTTLRQEITDRIEEARGHGDLKENAEYHSAKDEQGLNESRIRELEARLRHAVIEEVDVDSGVVGLGMIVSVDDDGDTEEFFIGSVEDLPEEGLEAVSATSPMGKAMIGSTVGDEISYTGPTGVDFSVTITGVRAP